MGHLAAVELDVAEALGEVAAVGVEVDAVLVAPDAALPGDRADLDVQVAAARR